MKSAQRQPAPQPRPEPGPEMQWFNENGDVRPEGTPGCKQLTHEERVAIAKKKLEG